MFYMVSMAKCVGCGIEFPDTHPGRSGNKFCCREHFREYKKIHGCGNKGKTWEETYTPETLKFMQDRVHKKGKEHWNYEKKRDDLLIRNLVNNPKRDNKINNSIQELLKKDPERALKIMLKSIGINKKYAYQRKAYEFYGKKCSVCGEIENQIDVHHKDKNRKNNKIENLQVLCASCHTKLHKNPLSNNI